MADRRLQVFHAVARHLSFTRAAEALFMTQPAVTFQIRQLEEHFNARLFDRAQGRIALTAAGAVALEYSTRILALSAELETRMKELSGQLAGPLLIGASTTIADFLLPQVLGEFKSRHPGIIPRLIVANSEIVQDRVAERTLDLGFIEGDSHLPTLVTDICCEDELQVVCAPSHPLARLASALPKSLTEHAYVSRELGSGTREVIDRYLHAAGVSPDSLSVFLELGSPEALKELAATGLAFAIMSRASVAKEIRLGELVHVPLAPPLVRNLSVVYPKERIQSRMVDSFVQFAKERLAARQARPPAG
ncbi:MAG TPA: LysR family transcriptional regulator [Casimicrobiaceae bacterium]|jgi:DNA-binding transcriptional LysR family regulator|nr:LysR family transcriptional regulator [Casimicrobiaceae bacterium]